MTLGITNGLTLGITHSNEPFFSPSSGIRFQSGVGLGQYAGLKDSDSSISETTDTKCTFFCELYIDDFGTATSSPIFRVVNNIQGLFSISIFDADKTLILSASDANLTTTQVMSAGTVFKIFFTVSGTTHKLIINNTEIPLTVAGNTGTVGFPKIYNAIDINSSSITNFGNVELNNIWYDTVYLPDGFTDFVDTSAKKTKNLGVNGEKITGSIPLVFINEVSNPYNKGTGLSPEEFKSASATITNSTRNWVYA